MSNPLGGPRTPEGKKRSALNALKHGLYAETSGAMNELAGVAGVDFAEVLERMNRHYKPADPVEEQLVIRIARCVWRLALSSSMEDRLLERGGNALRPGPSYDKVMRYERLVDIHLHRAIFTLQHKREADRTINRSPSTEATQAGAS